MARPLRIEFPGALYHVMSRGNERRAVVRDDRDREKRLEWLRRTVEDYGWRLHAFVLMTNHDHLFVETPQPNLSAAMQFLNGGYTSAFNRRHRRVGHLLQGRFKAQLIEQEGHYFEVSRYIHLNPVRAGIVRKPQDWPWSSYPGYHYANRTLEWVTYDDVLREFGRAPGAARAAYRRFVRQGMAEGCESPWEGAIGGLVVGSDRFLARVKKILSRREKDGAVPQLKTLRDRPALERIATIVAKDSGVNRSAWGAGRRSDDLARATAAYLARRRFGYPAGAVAKAMGYASASSVSRAVQRIEHADAKERTTMKRLERKLERLNAVH